MRLRLQNLGRIARADIELRPLTMFVGKNGLNKTWAAYAAFGGLQAMSFDKLAHQRHHSRSDALVRMGQEIADELQRLPGGGETTRVIRCIDIPCEGGRRDDAGGFVQAMVGELPAEAWVESDPRVVFESVRLHCTRIGRAFSIHAEFIGPNVRRSIVYPPDEGGLAHLLAAVLDAAVASVHRVVLLPTERSWVAQLGHASHLDLSIPPHIRLCAPWISEARERKRQQRRPGASDPVVADFVGQLTGGSYHVDESGVRHASGDVDLALHAAASLTRTLAPLVLYLETLATPGDVLVIDEPELNAHPEAQLAILELLAILANRGYHVIFTTHSPYLQDHLDNLMEASTLPSDVPVPQSLALGRRDAFLDPSRVAAYEFVEVGETVEVLPVLDRLERATTTRTFSEVSERLGDVMNQVLDLEEVAGG